MYKAKNTAKFQKVEETILEFLDTLEQKKRLEMIDDLLHRLNFERRLTALTDEERVHMKNETLSHEAKMALEKAETPAKRKELITMYARSAYFRQCAWADYLNGVRSEKPFSLVGRKKIGYV